MANVKITALNALSAAEVAGEDVFVIVDIANDETKKITFSNLKIATAFANDITNANTAVINAAYSNDYITYNILSSNLNAYANYSNTELLNLEGGLVASNSLIADLRQGLAGANANLYNTYLVAYANDGTTLGIAYANDVLTLASALSNDYSTYLTLSGGLTGANTSIATKDSISNVYSTYLTVKGGIDGANTAIVNLQTGLSGSNTRIVGVESNVLSLQSGIIGSNTAILNLSSGLTGANSAITAITNAPVTFESEVTIRGNLTLTGNTTIVHANTISFGDSLLSLASNNTISDNLDMGLYGHYWNGSANSHSGLFRSAISKDWMLFSNYIIDLEGNSTIDISNSSFELANIRVKNANASGDMYAANSIISSSIFSNGVELRANDYATLLAAYSNDYSNYLTTLGGLTGSNTAIINLQTGLTGSNTSIINVQTGLTGSNTAILNLQTGLTGTNTSVSTKDSIANVYTTYTILSSNINSVQSNLASYAAYANSTFGVGGGSSAYVVRNYVTTVSNSYYIGTAISSINNVSVYLNGVYQNKNQYILANSSSNIQFTDASLATSLSLETVILT